MELSVKSQPILTKAALAMQDKAIEFERISLVESPGLKSTLDKTPRTKNSSSPMELSNNNEFDIKKARHEVLNFAMNNQRVQKNQKKMLTYQLVKLGAKPPKKQEKNYKQLLDERKRLKDIREERKKFCQLGKNQAGAASVKCRSKSKQEKQAKKRAPVSSIDRFYGVVKPNLKKSK